MKKLKRLLAATGMVAALILSWLAAFSQTSDTQKQTELMSIAQDYLEDEVYILAVPYLEEAVSYHTAETENVEELLKKVYRQLLGQDNYTFKYTELLEAEMERENADEAVFREAFEYYMGQSQVQTALEVLSNGIRKTGSEKLEELYETNRYAYIAGYDYYDDVTEIYNGATAVMKDGLWGLAAADGSKVLPCRYEKISNYSNSRVIIQDGTDIAAIDTSGNRLALLHEEALDFGEFGESVIMLRLKDGWHISGSSFITILPTAYEELRMMSDGCAAAKIEGKWGLVNTAEEWILDPEYDEILCDELGRSYACSAVFVRDDEKVKLLTCSENGFEWTGAVFENAKPFLDSYAAVERDGKWGFTDTNGNIVIDFQFEDAKSFGQHLAAVKQNGFWGYVDLKGHIVIPCIYKDAKSFQDGHAAVKTEAGWMFISLLEYL